MTLKIHHLELFTQRCEIAATLNGVPIANVRSTDRHTDHFAPPVNPFLIGEGNVLEVSISPAPLEDGETTEWAEAKVEAAVRVFDKGGIVVPGGGGPAITEVDFAPELAERIAQAEEDDVELEAPQSFLHIFDNEGVSFASELLDAEPFDDQDALLDYAIHIRDLFAASDVDGFLAEIGPKCDVWSIAYEEPADFFRDQIRTGLETEFLPARPIVDFERADVYLRPIAGGRMWSLEKNPGLPLIQTPLNDEEQRMQFRIVAALRDGQLRIVR
ncbi:MAG: hypothetical protein KC619_00675 [Myxococcales bacterium]|nr:hypothetical protein [Myxococcales bacterium]